jgi:cytochrome c2
VIVRRLAVIVAALALVLAVVRDGAADTHASKGRRVFEAKGCAQCHLPGGGTGSGPPLEQLRGPQGAWELTGRFWNHVPAMFTAVTASGVSWPQFTPDEATALMTYLAATPDADPTPDPSRGLSVLVQKGCLKCHALRGEGARIAPDLSAPRGAFDSPAAWATRIWSHTPAMASAAMQRGVLYPRFSGQEMAQLVGYLRNVAGAPPAR